MKKFCPAMILIVTIFLTACGEALPVSSGGVVEYEPVDLVWGETYEGPLQGTQEYRMTVPDGAILSFEVTSTDGIVTYRLLSADSQLVGDNIRVGTTATFSVVVDHDGGGQYTFMVRGFDAAYQLKAGQTLQNDGGAGGDAPDSLEESVLIESGFEYTGNLGINDSGDAFQFDAPAHSLVKLTVSNPASSPGGVTVRGFAGGTVVFRPDPAAPGDTQVWYSSLGEDTSYAFTAVGTAARYSFTFELTPANDGGGGEDAGDSAVSAAPIALGETITGHLSRDDTDCFAFLVESGGAYELMTRNLPDPTGSNRGSINVFLRETESRRLVISQLVQFDEEITRVETLKPGEHFVCIVNDSPLALYEFTIQPFVER